MLASRLLILFVFFTRITFSEETLFSQIVRPPSTLKNGETGRLADVDASGFKVISGGTTHLVKFSPLIWIQVEYECKFSELPDYKVNSTITGSWEASSPQQLDDAILRIELPKYRAEKFQRLYQPDGLGKITGNWSSAPAVLKSARFESVHVSFSKKGNDINALVLANNYLTDSLAGNLLPGVGTTPGVFGGKTFTIDATNKNCFARICFGNDMPMAGVDAEVHVWSEPVAWKQGQQPTIGQKFIIRRTEPLDVTLTLRGR